MLISYCFLSMFLIQRALKRPSISPLGNFSIVFESWKKADNTIHISFYVETYEMQGQLIASTFLQVVPACYRKCFPVQQKSHRSHDVVLLCFECHEVAQKSAEDVKREIARYGQNSLVNPDLAASWEFNRSKISSALKETHIDIFRKSVQPW